MFNRGYNDRYKSRRNMRTLYYKAHGSIEAFQAFKLFRGAPIEDAGPSPLEEYYDAQEYGLDMLSDLTMWDGDLQRYTEPEPFCLPENKSREVTKMKRTSDSISTSLYKALNQEATELLEAGKVKEFGDLRRTFFSKGKDIKKQVSFSDQVSKAGGRLVPVPKGGRYPTVADWHDQDPT